MYALWLTFSLLASVAVAASLVDLDVVNAVDDTELADKTDEYFANIDVSLFAGEPDEEVGARVAALTPDSTISPESLGNYFEGDILLPPSDARNGLTAASSRWPGAIIPYTIEGPFNAGELAQIAKAMSAFTNNTCVRFVPRTSQVDYVTLKGSQSGCWASAGRVGGQQHVNLQTPACLWYVGTVMHELNHAIGFLHEQSREERDSFIDIIWGNIKNASKFNFNKHSPALYGFGVPYDYGSVMHYDPWAFTTNGQATIVAKQPLNGLVMGQRNALSIPDIIKINRMYNCTSYRMN